MLEFIKKNYCIILTILSIIAIIFCCMMSRRESFKLIDLVTPPLEIIKSEEFGYCCPINGYKCEPSMIYKIYMQGKEVFKHMKYVKYKLIDSQNVVRYSGLYKDLDELQIGSYIIFDNGQEYIVTTLDVNSVPSDCPTIRRKSFKD